MGFEVLLTSPTWRALPAGKLGRWPLHGTSCRRERRVEGSGVKPAGSGATGAFPLQFGVPKTRLPYVLSGMR